MPGSLLLYLSYRCSIVRTQRSLSAHPIDEENAMKTGSITAVISLALVAMACGSNTTPAPKTALRNSVLNDSEQLANMPKSADKGTSGMVSISDDIKQACGISDSEAYFAFDSAYVRQQDKQTLSKLSNCFTSGPLKGKQMNLVGHADPRGDDNYNLALGGARADSVKRVIVNEGMPSSKVSTSSRGEMDASGTDEASWARDRRVDVLLGG
jgi:peptidoglycan-associated lipoprotein